MAPLIGDVRVSPGGRQMDADGYEEDAYGSRQRPTESAPLEVRIGFLD
jgi:hypothetical protein